MPRMRGAVAAVIILLDRACFLRRDLQAVADELADPRVDLLPQIDVMRVERVVEIEHPGVDPGEAAGCSHLSHPLVPANAGTHTPCRQS